MKHFSKEYILISELFLGSDQMHLILSRHKTKNYITFETDQTPRLPETAHAMNGSMHASFCALVANASFYSSMDVPNSVARYSKTGTWIDWVWYTSSRIVRIHG
jgi:hypothetical protein